MGLVLVCLNWGCALASKAEPLSPRFFSPSNDIGSSRAPSAPASGLELRLGQIDSAAHLEERIAYRLSDTELGYYEDRRWTEPPEQYLRRALAHELFETRGIRRVVSGTAATLDVELVSFEELREGQPRARLGLSFSLRDDRRSLLERVLVVEESLGEVTSGDAAQRLAVAMSSALSKTVVDVADQVVRELERASVPSANPSSEPAPAPLSQ